MPSNYIEQIEALNRIVDELTLNNQHLTMLLEDFHNINVILQNIFVIMLVVVGLYAFSKLVTSII